MSGGIDIREYAKADREAIREINRQAFRMAAPGTFEKLIAALDDARAWVAVAADGCAVGHVIFTPALATGSRGEIRGMGLGELAVLPQFQRQGIGTLLGNAGIAALRSAGCPFIIVVGHAGYYPRFGFRPGASLGLACQWDKVPAETFMALLLDEAAMQGASGVARFRDVP
jgi:putative acetyltransferase